MDFLSRMEQRFGKFAIKNLTVYIIMTYVAGYILQMMYSGAAMQYISLNPGRIMSGQVWRLITWLLVPPTSLNILTLVMLFCYYQLGTLLERTWGAFFYNIYIFGGLFFTVVGAFLLYYLGGDASKQAFYIYDMLGSPAFSTYYVSLSIFLGFAMTYPEQQMLFMFIVPIKIKYLAYIDVLYLVYVIGTNAVRGYYFPAVVIVCSLLNVLIFFLLTKGSKFRPGQTRRQKEFQRAMGYGQAKTYNRRNSGNAAAQTGGISRHKCAICGRTEKTHPDLEFRFCSRCNGNYEYCQDHLFTHEHKK